jgi:hypothetical protein
MDDALVKKLARTYLAHQGVYFIDKGLAADISALSKRVREGDQTITLAMVNAVLDEVALECPELESATMLAEALK